MHRTRDKITGEENLLQSNMNLLEGVVYNLNEGYFIIKDQKIFDEGMTKILDGIESVTQD